MSDMQRQTLLIDGDDTLWNAQELYQEAEHQFRERLAAVVGASPDIIQAKFDEINSALAASMGFQEQRYPLAMERTYEYFASQRGLALDPKQQQVIRSIAESVFTLTPELVDGAKDVLASLAEHYALIFYSAGDERIQRGRLEQLDLARFFSGMRVVLQKNEDELRRLLADFSLTTQNTWVIGNSPRFDISPALRVGLRAIWLYSELWQDEKEDLVPRTAKGELAPYATVFQLREIPPMLKSFPPSPARNQTDARVDLYGEVIDDQSHTSTRRQNLTSVFIGLNTIALSGLAFLLVSLKRDGSLYLDIIGGLLIAISAHFVNKIYRMAMTKYDHMITVYAVYLRGIEDSFGSDLPVRVPGTDGLQLHPGVMNELGQLRELTKHRKRQRHRFVVVFWVISVWNWATRPVRALVHKLDQIRRTLWQIPGTRSPEYAKHVPLIGMDQDEWSNDEVKAFANAIKYRVEGKLANGFVKFFGWATVIIFIVLVLALAGVITGIPSWSPLHEWVSQWLHFQF